MTVLELASYAAGRWVGPGATATPILSAIDDEAIALSGGAELSFEAMIDHARKSGGPALRAMTFHDRARKLKELAVYLDARKEALYALSHFTGATRADNRIDVDGGIGTLFVYASKGRRELPDAKVLVDGDVEQLSKTGSFIGRHVLTPLQGVAVHINAFNFPVWGMLEKLAPTLLAGVPAIVKPATASAYVTEACFRMIVESGIFPEGSVQLVCGRTGDLLDRLGCQDAVSFTGSAATALALRSNANLLSRSVRFFAEQDSLNASILGPDAIAGTPEFDLFIKEVVREMTAKAGQKCTAIRRILVPHKQLADVSDAISAKLAAITIGDPRNEKVRMGALVSRAQRADVLDKCAAIGRETTRVFGDPTAFELVGGDKDRGAFLPPMLFRCDDPDGAHNVHSVEAFGPVSTLMAYRDIPHAIKIANRGGGSLVLSAITHDPAVAAEIVAGSASHHGRIYFNDRTSMAESTGHGSPMPHMVHGGPGRAGGGEELGGIRGAKHYMQRTAIQGSPAMITAITGEWVPGSPEIAAPAHPFTRKFGELAIGETIHTVSRTITLEDIEHFAAFTGDTFYAHMDEDAAKANPFFPGRVAHGYLLLSFAAGLFVEPNPGPVLANTGLEGLSFKKPVTPGDSIAVRLTVKKKTPRTDSYGEVRWNVTLNNQDGEEVAQYELHTMNLC